MSLPRTQVFLNGSVVQESEVRAFLAAAADRSAREAAGGFLFRAHLSAGGVFIGVIPAYRDTRRYYHYDIRLGTHEWPILTGEFQVEGAVRVLCPPESGRVFTEDERRQVRDQLADFAGFVIDLGYPGEAPLDWITVKWLLDSGITPESPGTLASLGSGS